MTGLLGKCAIIIIIMYYYYVYFSPFYKWTFCDPKELAEKEDGGVAVLTKTKVGSCLCKLRG